MLYVMVAEFVSPTFMDLSFSISMVVWAAVGGRGSLLGACIGAILINTFTATVSETKGFRRSLESHHRVDLRSRRIVSCRAVSPDSLTTSATGLSRAATRMRTASRRRSPQPGKVPAGGRHAMTAALTVDGLSVDFAGFKAVNTVSMIVEEGELRVLLGANGAGKTTLMDLDLRQDQEHSGRDILYDTEITNKEEHDIARAGIGRKFQIPSVFRELTVRRNLEVVSCRDHAGVRQPRIWLSPRRRGRASTRCRTHRAVRAGGHDRRPI